MRNFLMLMLLATLTSCSVENNVAPKPLVETYHHQNIQDVSVEFGGNVYNDAGSNITEKGIVISTSTEMPTISDTKIIAGNGEGEFYGIYAGLEGNTTYHYRAFGTNASGTGYGEAFTFTTLPSPCSPTHGNVVSTGAGNLEVDNVIRETSWVNYDNGNVQFYTQSQGSYVISLQFNEVSQRSPETGIYSTTQIFLNSDTPSDRRVKIYFSDTGHANGGFLAPDGEFIFVENNDGVITFTLCDALINSQYTLNGMFTYNP